MNTKELKHSIDFRKRPTFRNGKFDREAAVVIPLVWKENCWQVLFQVRSRHLKIQPGDICFPGGGVDAGETPEETAVREVCEELLLEPAQIDVLGQVDGTIGPTGSPIWAFAAVLQDYHGTFSVDEVAEVFTVPLEELCAITPQTGLTKQRSEPQEGFPKELIPGYREEIWIVRQKELLFYPWNGYMIWGATARLLHSFLERWNGGARRQTGK